MSSEGVPRFAVRPSYQLLATMIVACALFLRLLELGAQPLWYDEAFSWFIASSRHFLSELARENSPPLYYVLLRGFVAIAGDGEAGVRLLSVVAGTAFVAAMLWTARALFGETVALCCGLFAAVAPYHVYYSQEARAYALLSAFLALSYGALQRALQRNSAGAWWLFALASALASATHLFAALGLFACIVPVLACRDRQRLLRFLAASAAAVGVTAAWLVLSSRYALRTPKAFEVVRAAWDLTPPALAIPRSLELFVLGGQEDNNPLFLKQLTQLEFPVTLRVLALVAAGALACVALVPWADGALNRPELRRTKVWLATALVGPLIVLWLVSALYRPVYLVGRYDIVAFAACPLLLGLGLGKLLAARTRPAWALAAVAALALGGPVAWKLAKYYGAPAPTDAAATAQLLDRDVASDDLVVFTGSRGTMGLYYLHLLGHECSWRECAGPRDRRYRWRIFPVETELELTPLAPPSLAHGSDATDDARRADARDTLAAVPSNATAWFVLGNTLVVNGRAELSPDERILMQEATKAGFRLAPFEGGMSILRLRR